MHMINEDDERERNKKIKKDNMLMSMMRQLLRGTLLGHAQVSHILPYMG